MSTYAVRYLQAVPEVDGITTHIVDFADEMGLPRVDVYGGRSDQGSP